MSRLGVGLGLRIWLEKQTALLWEKEGPDVEGREIHGVVCPTEAKGEPGFPEPLDEFRPGPFVPPSALWNNTVTTARQKPCTRGQAKAAAVTNL